MRIKLQLLLITGACSLFACGGDKVVETQDESAEYRSARALPPLIKDLEPATAESAAAAIPEPYVPRQASDGSVTLSIISKGDKRLRLQVNAEFERAWTAISEKLKSSAITVHNRNRNAGRIAIGCGELSEPELAATSGGWSVFRKKPAKESEYCALQMLPGKRRTEVQVLNRNAQEVGKAAAQQVFDRLLGGSGQ